MDNGFQWTGRPNEQVLLTILWNYTDCYMNGEQMRVLRGSTNPLARWNALMYGVESKGLVDIFGDGSMQLTKIARDLLLAVPPAPLPPPR